MMFLTRCHQSRSHLLVDLKRAQRQIAFPRTDFRGRGSLGRCSIPPQHHNEYHVLRHLTTKARRTIQYPLLRPYDRTRALFFSVLQDDTFCTVDDEAKEESQPSTQFSAEALVFADSKKDVPSFISIERDLFLRHLVLGIQVNVQGIVTSVDVAKTKPPAFSLVLEEEDVSGDEHAADDTETKDISRQQKRAFQGRWNSERKKERRRLGKLALFSKGQNKPIEAIQSSSKSHASKNVAETREDDAWNQLWKAATAQIDEGSLTKTDDANQNGGWERDQSVSLDGTNDVIQQLGSVPVEKDPDDKIGMDTVGTLRSYSFGAMEIIAEEDYGERNMSDSKTNEFDGNIRKDEEEQIIDALAQTIALLSIMSKNDWVVIDATDAGKVLSMIREDQTDGDGKIEAVKDQENPVIFMHKEEIRDIHQLLLDARAEKYVLTTLESNLLLSRLVTTTLNETNDAAASPDIIMSTALELYEEMVALGDSGQEDCAPDETTYQLLLLALDRRFLAQSEAVRLFQKMVHASSPKVNYGAETFLFGMQACYNRGDLVVAQDCMQKVVNGTDNLGASRSSSLRPPAGAYLILCGMLQKEHAWREAIALLDVALKPSSKLKDFDFDRLVLSLCRWNLKARRGDVMGPSSFLLEILQRLEHRDANNQTSEFLVWSTIIERLSRLSKDDDSMWQHVQRAFDLLWIAHPDCHPGRKLLRIGIEASKATSNGRLASQVIFNEVATFAPSPFASAGPTDIGTEESVIEDRESLDEAATKSLNVHKTGLGGSPIAYGILRTGLEVCMASGDIESASLILHSFEKVSSLFPLAKQTELYGLALMVYAQVGDSEASKSLLQAMKSRGMKPSEKLYGAVMHCLATNGSFDEACGMLESMDDVQPGVSCYNAILLSHLRSRSWDDAIRLQERMKASGITPDASTAQGLLLASYGTGGKDQTQICLEDLLDAEVQMAQETFQVASKILLPKKSNGGAVDVREALRDVADTVPHMRSVALDLIRSIRIAEVDQKRKPSKRQPIKVLHQKRNASWRQVMTYLISYVKASNGHAEA